MSESVEIITETRPRRKDLPPVEYLRECFTYDPETGSLKWNRRPREHFSTANSHGTWNSKWSGTEAGRRKYDKFGNAKNIAVSLADDSGKKIMFYAHVIIYSMMEITVPDGHMIDHRDRNPHNNRIDNLRIATHNQNSYNRKKKCDSDPNMPKCVRPHNGKFWARIQVNGKRRSLGLHSTPEEAYAAYCKAAKELHGEFASLT